MADLYLYGCYAVKISRLESVIYDLFSVYSLGIIPKWLKVNLKK